MPEVEDSANLSKLPDEPRVDPLLGRDLNGKFSILELIAKGGMGAVYKARQAPLGRICAIKVLTPRSDQPDSFIANFHKRFFLEASTAAKLTHPNTVTIYDYGKTEDGVYFMAMEYLEGVTLSQCVKQNGPLSEERAVSIGMQVCRSLREAHAMGIVHRDIKTANIYMVTNGDEEDFVKVLDFGLVKDVDPEDKSEELTQAGVFMGSPRYMSPEQIQGNPVDARTDIYSLGVVLYEMMAGRPPFDKGSSIEILMGHMKTPPPPIREVNPTAEISPGFEGVIAKCLAKNAEDRFASMDELLMALKRSGGAAGSAFLATAEYQSISGSMTTGSTSGHHVFLAASGSSQGQPTPPAPVESGGGSRTAIAVLGLVAAAAVTILGVKIMGGKESTAAQPPAAVKSAEVKQEEPKKAVEEPVVASAKPVEQKPTEVKIRVDSEPTGAWVRLNDEKGKEICQTPCDVAIEPGKSEQNVALVKQGYVIVSKTLHTNEPKLMVSLVKVAAQPGAAAPKPGGGGAPEGGFRAVPY